jgi:hypothetical protein
MTKIPHIIKASGESEPFNREKLEGSLRRSGASSKIIDEVVSEVVSWIEDGTSTKKIYSRAFNLLQNKRRSMAARYSLKKALMELGPTGYPFEHFVGQIFQNQGFEVQVGRLVQGQCVQHEVDVVATNSKNQHFVECKYYNSQDKHANVQVPLYIRSRVDDIIRKRKSLPEYNDFSFFGWIVTNTRFTSDAMDFGKCAGLHLVSWDYPKDHSLKDMIEKARFFPITTLTQLTRREKLTLMEKGVVLCRQLNADHSLIDIFNFTKSKKASLLKEIKELSEE